MNIITTLIIVFLAMVAIFTLIVLVIVWSGYNNIAITHLKQRHTQETGHTLFRAQYFPIFSHGSPELGPMVAGVIWVCSQCGEVIAPPPPVV